MQLQGAPVVYALLTQSFLFFSTSDFVFFKSEFVFCHVIRGTRHCTKQNANGTVDHDL